MTLTLLKAKLHRIRITEACLDYEGSLTLDPDDMEAVGIRPYEKILCADVENGNRFETYAIAGARGLRAEMEKHMTDVMYEAPGNAQMKKVVVTTKMIEERLGK